MNQEEQPTRHIIKWEDGQDRWMMDIRPGNVSLFTTAPVDRASVDALADQWARAYDWISNRPEGERK